MTFENVGIADGYCQFPLRMGPHLYLMQNMATGNIKIGSTKNPERRCSEIENACGAPVELLRVLEDEGCFEEEMHEVFDAYRLPYGEWFRPAELLVEFANGDKAPEWVIGARYSEMIAEDEFEDSFEDDEDDA